MVFSRPSSTQIGLLAENLVVNSLIVESAGRFVPFRPLADDYGIDVLIFDKQTGRALPLQVKGRTKTLKKGGTGLRGDIVHFHVRKVALRDKGSTRLLAVLLDEEMTGILKAWLIPLEHVERLGAMRRDRVVIRPSRSDVSKDKYSPYRGSMKELVIAVTKEFERFDTSFPRVNVLR
jgi:hypothetical protein